MEISKRVESGMTWTTFTERGTLEDAQVFLGAGPVPVWGLWVRAKFK